MSVIGINKLTLALEHEPGLLDAYRSDPDATLRKYSLSDDERDAIGRLDAHSLLARGVNPIVIRNLLVILGIPHGEMYTHGETS